MIKVKLTLTLAFSVILSYATSQVLTLSTELSSDRFMIGETIDLILKIENVDPAPVHSTEAFDISTQNEFRYEFSIVPTQTGKLIVGPYSIDYNDQKLTSNELKLTIRNRLKENEISIGCPNEAVVGEEILVELTNTKEILDKVKITGQKEYKGDRIGSTSNVTFTNGVKTASYTVRFKLTFYRSGKYKIDRSWFVGIPEHVHIKDAQITIKDSVNQSIK